MAELLIQRGARLDVKDVYGRTAIHYAREKNGSGIVELLKQNLARS
jgi:ankyrin repeat protein